MKPNTLTHLRKVLVLAAGMYPTFLLADGEVTQDLFSMSLEELMHVNYSTGSLSGANIKKSPAAITVIQREQIQLSNARNLAILIEQYVPGLIVLAHSQGDKIGMRGHVAAENYKLLLLVNGKNVTNKVYEGVITELDTWDMSDIQRVEVIRGPGSVTYGSGAIAGVINIITRDGSDGNEGWRAGLRYDDKFQSSGVSLQYTGELKGVKTFGHVSFQSTSGLESPDYYQMAPDPTSDIRYVGKRPDDLLPPQNYLRDNDDRPQIKGHLALTFSERWNAWFRYTQSGQSHGFISKKQLQQDGQLGEPINSSGVSLRSFISNLSFTNELDERRKIDASVTYDTQEYLRFDIKNTEFAVGSPENLKDYAFSQNRLVANLLYHHQFNDDLNLILGYEFDDTRIRAPWGKSKDHLWIREGVHFVSSLENSVYTQDLSLSSRPRLEGLEEVGEGIEFQTHTNLLELTYDHSDATQIQYSHRIDFPDASGHMYSPRLAVTHEYNEDNTLVISTQRSLRMAPLRAQYLMDMYEPDAKSRYERQDTLELSWTNTSFENTSINLRSYYSDVRAVGFTGARLEFLNDAKFVGVEAELLYKSGALELSANHSFTDVLDSKMNEDLKDGTNRNNISFADYYYMTRGDFPLLLEGYGEGFNNLPTNLTKLWANYRITEQWIAHVNLQVLWDLEGSLDEVKMYRQAYERYDTSALSAEELVLFEAQRAEFEREMSILEREDAFGFNYNLSASITYTIPSNNQFDAEVSFYINNLLDSYDRVYVSTGSTRAYPDRLSFLQEPRTWGVNLNVNF